MFPKYFKKVIFIFSLLMIIFSLLSVAFYTLMERKIMSINQLRLGPNKLMMNGIIQPIFDGFKLFLKLLSYLNNYNLFYFFSPIISFVVSMMFISFFLINNYFYKNLMFLILLGIGVYAFVLSGWSSFSKFGYLGGIRASSQTLSYEISLSIIILMLIIFINNYNFTNFNNYLLLIYFPLLIIWMMTLISETNRAPFDFSEGESELISGFNIEYGSSGFVLFFLSEYSMMIFFSFFSSFIFSNKTLFFIFLFIFILLRTSFPRFRYDFLQEFMWLKMLPFSCCLLFLLILV